MLTKLFVKASLAAQSFKKDESGVTAIEYGLIAAAIAGGLALAFNGADGIGAMLGGIFEDIRTALGGAERPAS